MDANELVPYVRRHSRHSSPAAHTVATRGLVLLARSGSEAHGTAVGEGDIDRTGIALEPPGLVTGVERLHYLSPGDEPSSTDFEQYEAHTAWDREGGRGLDERSGPGDIDVTVFSARKWARLILAGNMTALTPLYVAPRHIEASSPFGEELRTNRDRFVSRAIATRAIGFVAHQMPRAFPTGAEWSAKTAAHSLRLAVEATELITTGSLALPLTDERRDAILAIRSGQVAAADAREAIDTALADLRAADAAVDLPDRAPSGWVSDWLHRAHLDFWCADLRR